MMFKYALAFIAFFSLLQGELFPFKEGQKASYTVEQDLTGPYRFRRSNCTLELEILKVGKAVEVAVCVKELSLSLKGDDYANKASITSPETLVYEIDEEGYPMVLEGSLGTVREGSETFYIEDLVLEPFLEELFKNAERELSLGDHPLDLMKELRLDEEDGFTVIEPGVYSVTENTGSSAKALFKGKVVLDWEAEFSLSGEVSWDLENLLKQNILMLYRVEWEGAVLNYNLRASAL